jgi:hypothetical protein
MIDVELPPRSAAFEHAILFTRHCGHEGPCVALERQLPR